ncbi:MAG: hypothetical protein M3Z85_07890 [Acidobacteriota bacterium]|nr:hypothetical protein [Acidobacteriota bacterium]
MATSPYRTTVTIDGTSFEAVSADVAFETLKDRAGMPAMGSLSTSIRVWVDFHDDKNMPNSQMQKLFTMANVVTRGKVKDMKIEFWKDDAHQDALCSYSFKGWISGFHTCNPLPAADGAGINHLLELDLEPTLNTQNFKEIKLSN